MIIYEVNLRVVASVEEAYRAWLAIHVRELLDLPGFCSAEFFEVQAQPADLEFAHLCVQYRLASASALARYLEVDAPRMRAEGQLRFAGQFTATRRVMSPVIELLAQTDKTPSIDAGT